MTQLTVKIGQKPTKEQLQEICEAAALHQDNDPDCPPSGPAALAEFAAKARELRRSVKHTKPAVTIRLAPECLEAYKALGRGYTSIMSDVLAYAANNPEFLKQVLP
ncbi:MAG: BrnA antitoxin family protein [Desulfovibrio sp.]|jgi:uncharacterized protein (DUF4415 family)|nr:BrnA antitoxin family protein [Desulfovibrio sp.]